MLLFCGPILMGPPLGGIATSRFSRSICSISSILASMSPASRF